MTIFEHKGTWTDKVFLDSAWQKMHRLEKCIYCQTHPDPEFKSLPFIPMRLLHYSERDWVKDGRPFSQIDKVMCCDLCGWWYAWRKITELVDCCYIDTYASSGNLFPLDMIPDNDSIEVARTELYQNWASKKTDIHPKKLEEIVASVFQSFGYHAYATAYSNDGGIDVVLEYNGKKFGVQVKRYKNTIRVEEIRSFAGALLLNGLPSGVFVTTSDYQRGCHSTASKYGSLGIPIELVNGERFFDALEIKKRDPYRDWSELFDEKDHQLTLLN